MPYSGNSWQQLVVGLFQVVLCRRAAIPRLAGFGTVRSISHSSEILRKSFSMH
jgi:hypothetical protein